MFGGRGEQPISSGVTILNPFQRKPSLLFTGNLFFLLFFFKLHHQAICMHELYIMYIFSNEMLIYQVRDIRYSFDRGYRPSSCSHTSDIAVLILKQPIVFNNLILPACIDWMKRPPFKPEKMNIGKVSRE